jgi:outer membrane receptor for ferrienterochelin and colicin
MFSRNRLLLAVVLTLFAASLVQAQVTTGNLAGTVTASDGSALPGVTIEATHVPTGTNYSSVTGNNGRFQIPNVRVGGPYRVTANLDGFQQAEVTRVQVGLGATAEVPITLQLAGLAEAITVSARAEVIDTSRAGSASAVSEVQIEALPTVNRSLQDFARTNPYFSVDQQDQSASRIYVAGRNNRYNTIQIDGAVNNDLFGLADTGTPGGQADANPISLEAIQELQLVVSPYDVRQGGFTGGGINAITRSGTNDWSGSLFGNFRDESFVGDGPLNRPSAPFEQTQYGGRFGGPILRDRLFFFFSGELSRRESPSGYSVDASTGVPVSSNVAADAIALRNFVQSTYQYDVGGLGDIVGATDSDLAFVRFDWNVNNRNQLTLRHNYVEAIRDVIADRSTTRVRFPNAIYGFASETNSTVAQLNSVFSSSAFNEARIGLQTIRDERATPGSIFPSVEIGGTGPRNGTFNFGTERFSGANALDQDILEITNDFTWIRGNHTLTFGTHNELFEFKNLFLSEFYGYYYFPTMAAFQQRRPTEYRISFATGDDPRRPTAFNVEQWGLYVNDQWRLTDSLTLNMGIRGDMPRYPDTPSFNPTIQNLLGYSTADTPSEDVVWSPRIGFNWSPGGAGRMQVRGGVGVFAGRTPYVWVSNAYGNTGIESVALSCIAPGCTPPDFNANPLTQPRNVGAGGALSVDLMDPDFEFPRVLRATLGYDTELLWGVRATLEGVWSQTERDVFYYNVNREPLGTSPLDGRPTFRRVTTNVADAILLSNTSKGEEQMYTLQLSRPFRNGVTVSASYMHQDTKSSFDATSSRAISNWQFRHTKGDIFEQDLSRSAFEVEDRFNTALSYVIATGPFGHTFGLFYNAQAGRPYSIMMGGDPNLDGYSTNDLLYIPASADAIILRDSTGATIPYERLANFLRAAGVDPTAGRILNRYELSEPWTHQLDFSYELGLPSFSGVRASLMVDVINVLNLIDEDYGKVKYVANQNYTVVNYAGIDAATGKPIYRESTARSLEPNRQLIIADQRSRWQARAGVRLSF